MSVKRDPDGRRSVQVEVEVPGTQEEVWQAIASGPGISAWFVPTTVDEKGGETTSDFGGGMVQTAKITAFEAPHRYVAEAPGWGEGMPPIATEWTVEAGSGGTCIVRVVHSLFADTDDWDGQLEGTEKGWPTYFRVLRRYLEQFAGQPSAQILCMVMTQQTTDELWSRFAAAMDVADAEAGHPLSVDAGPGLRLTGTVTRVVPDGTQRSVLVDLQRPGPGTLYAGVFACGGAGAMVSFQAYVYGENAEGIAREAQPLVQQWLEARMT